MVWDFRSPSCCCLIVYVAYPSPKKNWFSQLGEPVGGGRQILWRIFGVKASVSHWFQWKNSGYYGIHWNFWLPGPRLWPRVLNAGRRYVGNSTTMGGDFSRSGGCANRSTRVLKPHGKCFCPGWVGISPDKFHEISRRYFQQLLVVWLSRKCWF